MEAAHEVTRPYLVIDASVLGHAGENSPLGDACFESLLRSIRLYTLVLDNEGYIEYEYDKRIREKGHNSFISRWKSQVLQTVGLRAFYSGKLTASDRRLLEQVGFDQDDFSYVAVAKRAGMALIVHEDTNYCNAENTIVKIAGCRCIHPPNFIRELDAGRLP
jgi:hypothetical protein